MDIEIKTPEQLHLMRAAGLVVAAALAAARDAVKPGVSTAELDAVAEDVIRSHGAIPSFKGYHGFPGTICSSVNEQIVHTIPNPKHVLAEGDLISIDCGAILDGWHGDAAITVGVGETRPDLLRMAEVAEDSMWAGIAAAARGVRSGAGRLTDISWAVESAVRKAPRKYGIVKGYGGHGIGTAMHQEPHIHNHGRPGRGPQLIPGMALAIEPMITMGSARTAELNDGWTVVTTDGSHAAHVEHSIGLFEDGVWVLTAPDGGRARLGDLLTSAATA
ncbi:type I methionyl aminopeptidase [Catellatospora coxensis]|uniref:Methionine aminopeptidase n=1 Tax=Catellatospora coxensis TaxID=310354 RepID=A0A8J3KRE4_9ACTN|nr:type I methionyl aminopeptidase [Catellatospora coxensis]GIG05810.1 methionine aminopeptidase [Catellatospora coxensis]